MKWIYFLFYLFLKLNFALFSLSLSRCRQRISASVWHIYHGWRTLLFRLCFNRIMVTMLVITCACVCVCLIARFNHFMQTTDTYVLISNKYWYFLSIPPGKIAKYLTWTHQYEHRIAWKRTVTFSPWKKCVNYFLKVLSWFWKSRCVAGRGRSVLTSRQH